MSERQSVPTTNTKLPKESYGRILKYMSIFGSIQGLGILILLVRNKIAALILGPNGTGLVSLFNSTVNFMSQLTNMGISFSAVRHLSEIYEKGDRQALLRQIEVIRVWSFIVAVLGLVVCVALGNVLSNLTFDWGNHTIHFILLSPAVASMAIAGGETAILKATRQVKSLAYVQILLMIVSLLVSAPLYFFFHQMAIVPVIVLVAVASMLLTVIYSYSLFPLSISSLRGIFVEGRPMLVLGLAFILAGIMGSGSDIVVRSFLNVNANLDITGLYSAGYTITVTYAGLVFASMETDFYPRLSAINHDNALIKEVVNRQIEISILMISPLLVALILLLPVVTPLLYSSSFTPVISMAQVATLAMYLRCVTLPVSYIALAKGDSRAYLIIEALYDIAYVVFIIIGYRLFGLFGTGLAITISYTIEFFFVSIFARLRYNYRMSRSAILYFFIQVAFAICIYLITFIQNNVVYWIGGVVVFALSLTFSLYFFYKKIHKNPTQ